MKPDLRAIILGNLLKDEDYARKVLPYLQRGYFRDVLRPEVEICFVLIQAYFDKYDRLPSRDALDIELQYNKTVTEDALRKSVPFLDSLFAYDRGDTSAEWLLDHSEKWVKNRALEAGMDLTVAIRAETAEGLSVENIPEIWSKALAVSFDNRIGHDWLEHSEERLDLYHTQVSRIPFDLELMNKITRGGLPKKSLSCIMAQTGKGKSMFMVSMAASHYLMGYNVLYITLEMGEKVPGIGERLDANLLNIRMEDLSFVDKNDYRARLVNLRTKTTGRIIVQEYATATANVSHFRRLLDDLKVKKQFVPDIIYVDYVNLCTSIRIRQGSDFNSYTYIKYIAEELRGLAVQYDVPVVTATQINRPGYNMMEVDVNNVSESIGLPNTLDFFIALITNEKLEAMGQIWVRQLKNRWRQERGPKRFALGLDRDRAKLYNLDPAAQHGVDENQDEEEEEPTPEKKFKPVRQHQQQVRPALSFKGVT